MIMRIRARPSISHGPEANGRRRCTLLNAARRGVAGMLGPRSRCHQDPRVTRLATNQRVNPAAPPDPALTSPSAAAAPTSTIAGWGRIPVPGREVLSEDLERLTRDAVLCRGLGRSYGDASLPPPSHPEVAASPLADRIL